MKLKESQKAIDKMSTEARNAFQNGEYILAIEKFTQLINMEPTNCKHYLNRCSSYTNIREYDKALKDAQACIQKDSGFVKGYINCVMIQKELKLFDDALKTVDSGLTIDPSNQNLLEQQKQIQEILNKTMKKSIKRGIVVTNANSKSKKSTVIKNGNNCNNVLDDQGNNDTSNREENNDKSNDILVDKGNEDINYSSTSSKEDFNTFSTKESTEKVKLTIKIPRSALNKTTLHTINSGNDSHKSFEPTTTPHSTSTLMDQGNEDNMELCNDESNDYNKNDSLIHEGKEDNLEQGDNNSTLMDQEKEQYNDESNDYNKNDSLLHQEKEDNLEQGDNSVALMGQEKEQCINESNDDNKIDSLIHQDKEDNLEQGDNNDALMDQGKEDNSSNASVLRNFVDAVFPVENEDDENDNDNSMIHDNRSYIDQDDDYNNNNNDYDYDNDDYSNLGSNINGYYNDEIDKNESNDDNCNEDDTNFSILSVNSNDDYPRYPTLGRSYEYHVDKVFAIKKVDNEKGGVHDVALIKFKELSHCILYWEPVAEIEKDVIGIEKLAQYRRHRAKSGLSVYVDDDFTEDYIVDPEWKIIERILKTKEDEVRDEDVADTTYMTTVFKVKWKKLGYADATYVFDEDIADQENGEKLLNTYKRMQERKRIAAIQAGQVKQTKPRPVFRKKVDKKDLEEKILNDIDLRTYQVDGINWLISQWHQSVSSILADEMGLGKTIQCIAFIEFLRKTKRIDEPVLILAPISTLGHWQKEFEQRSDASVVVYDLARENKDLIEKYEMSTVLKNGKKYMIPNFDVLIAGTSKDNFKFFKKINWSCLIIDEAHQKLRELKSVTRNYITELNVNYKLLLTGTPIQNNIEELFSLLSLIDPNGFQDKDDFLSKFESVTTSTKVEELQKILKRYILLRLKSDVGINLPNKLETIIDIELTFDQKQYYRAILERNRQFLIMQSSNNSHNVPQLKNILTEIRKCCNHPFLVKGARENLTQSIAIPTNTNDPLRVDPLIFLSGKMVFIHKLLPKLQSETKKVLIFSQMTTTLDIIEEYLIQYKYGYKRIDGTVNSIERESRIRQFNDPRDSSLVFLLSTKAGGQGINLQAATIVIIFDSDFNPHGDTQAIARCHRLGQLQEVKVFRLLSKNTSEYEYFIKANRKLGFSEAILGGINENSTKSKETGRDIEDILRNGSIVLLEEDGENARERYNAFFNDDINKILESGHEMEVTGSGFKSVSKSLFSQATFVFDDVVQDSKNININDANFWEKALKVRESKFSKLKNWFNGSKLDELKSNEVLRKEKVYEVYQLASEIEKVRKSADKDYDEECQEVIEFLDSIVQIPSELKIFNEADVSMFLKLKESIINPKRHRSGEIDYKEVGINRSKGARVDITKVDTPKVDLSPLISIFSAADFNRESSVVTAFELFARSCVVSSLSLTTLHDSSQLLRYSEELWEGLNHSSKNSWCFYAVSINDFMQTVTDNGTSANFELEDILRDFCLSVGAKLVHIQNIKG